MLSEKVEQALNDQIKEEFDSSQLYLAMASWAETKGLNGAAEFLYAHSDEEREHGLKLFHYVNDRGGHAITPELKKPDVDYSNLHDIFKGIYKHETYISSKINDLVGICLGENDFTTQNFLQWFVQEQIEEETLFGTLLDKLELLGDHPGKMFMFDNELSQAAKAHVIE